MPDTGILFARALRDQLLDLERLHHQRHLRRLNAADRSDIRLSNRWRARLQPTGQHQDQELQPVPCITVIGKLALRLLRGTLRPRVQVDPAPTDNVVEWNVPVRVRDGTVLRVNVRRSRIDGWMV